MSKIYTKTGDKGLTSLMNGQRVSKSALRVETYGTLDELNSSLGLVVAELRIKNKGSIEIKKELLNIQNDLFEIGSMVSNPKTKYTNTITKYFEERIISFEKFIDFLTAKLPPLKNFILPGGTRPAAFLHVARSICRRCERRLVQLSQKEKVENVFIKYLNRLSDLLFTMSRFANKGEKKKEIIWKKKV